MTTIERKIPSILAFFFLFGILALAFMFVGALLATFVVLLVGVILVDGIRWATKRICSR